MGVPHVATIPTVEVERILRCKAEGDLVRKPLAQITNNPTDRSMLQALIGQHLTGNPEDGRWDGESYGYFTTSNPEGRWDWHLVGGGWCGFYILHSGIEKDAFLLGEDNKLSPTPYGAMAGRADVARKGAIDFEGTRFRAGALQENRHDCYSEATQGIEAPEPWGHVLAQMVQGAVAQNPLLWPLKVPLRTQCWIARPVTFLPCRDPSIPCLSVRPQSGRRTPFGT